MGRYLDERWRADTLLSAILASGALSTRVTIVFAVLLLGSIGWSVLTAIRNVRKTVRWQAEMAQTIQGR